ncbi:ParB family protein [Vibrio hibernica]|uniref:ParB family protein n=1 Tax=Vibrio hibernica TaxID=2587465 RepID=UPI001881EE30|nr:ParB family protein [Vibrio hibernica]
MAKKRGAISPLGNTVGSQAAQQGATQSNIESLSRQLTTEVEKSGQSVHDFLAQQFGINAVGQSMVWELASGTKATFHEVTLSYEQVKNDTKVTFDVNGRDQSLLTKESLQDLDSIQFQQFYPAVGHEVNGKIDVLDGSRRRARFLLEEGKLDQFKILVTKDALSTADAKALAKQLQTAKEHNLREMGMQCLALKKSNDEITQAEIAQQLGLSQAGVSKAIKAANVDAKLVSLFPVVNDLSHPDYALLDKVMKAFSDKVSFTSFVKTIQKKSVNIQAEYSLEDQKDALLLAIRTELKIAEAKLENDKAEVTPLAEFDTKGLFARKRVKGRNFSYEFGRLPKKVQDELDKAIEAVLYNMKQ